MTHNRFVTLLASATLFIASATAVTPQSAQQAVDKFTGDSTLAHATVGVAVADITTGQLIAGNIPETSAITASTMKTITSSTALQILGSDFKFHTRVMMHGQVDGDKLKGDLVIIGGGDPTLGSAYFKSNPDIVGQVVDSLTSLGIKKINGKIIVKDTIYPFPAINPRWQADDLAWDYGMGVHSLNYSDNRVMLNFNVSGSRLTNVRLTPNVPGLEVIDRLNPGNADNIDLMLETAHPAIVVTGQGDPMESYKLRVTNPLPASLLVDSLERSLARAEIKVRNRDHAVRFDDDQPDTLTMLVDHESPRLASIITSLLERSDNMFTEGLLRAVAYHSGRRATHDQGTAVADSLWQACGLNTKALFQYDGSGLARANKASAHFFVDMLNYMADKRWPDVRLCDLMPRIGVNARIGSLIPGSRLSGKVAVKSGSMTDVQCYVGYYPAQQPRYSFAVLVNNWNGSRKDLKNHIDRLLIDLFDEGE